MILASLVLVMLISSTGFVSADSKPVTVSRKLSEVSINGSVMFPSNNLNDNNYLKLGDIAAALSETEKQFNVTWDSSKNAINLVSNSAYE